MEDEEEEKKRKKIVPLFLHLLGSLHFSLIE